MLYIFVLTLFFNIILSKNVDTNPFVKLPDGSLRGETFITENNKTYYSFRGIPFAQPPIHDNRFQAPKPANPWKGVRNATKDPPSCVTFERGSNENEDCLYVNVYTPDLNPQKKLPVLFWIYGGGFITGCSEKFIYGPDYIVEEDVILVTHNYRVGPFGFLSTGDKVIAGNAGLKDQVLALQWTQKNIESFGGDPSRITIFGQSAGGTSVGLHLQSKLSTGLFRAAIVESGSGIAMWAVNPNPMQMALQLANKIGDYNGGINSIRLRDYFLSKSTQEIIESAMEIQTQYEPNLEPQSEDAFLTEPPYQLFEEGRFNHVPTMIGMTAEEGISFLDDERAKTMAAEYDAHPIENLIPEDLTVKPSEVNNAVNDIKAIYLKTNETFSKNFGAVAQIFGDIRFSMPALKQAELQSVHTPVYLYQYSYAGRRRFNYSINGIEKAGHTAELPFLFNYRGLCNDSNPTNVLVQKRTTKLWTNFAKYLTPTPKISRLFSNISWPTYDNTERKFLNINGTLQVENNLKEKTYNKWNDIYHTYHQGPFITF